MNKVIMSIFLFLSILCFSSTACYSYKTITKSNEIRKVLEQKNEFYLFTSTSDTYYYFTPYQYQYQLSNDTLWGSLQVVNSDSSRSTVYVRINIKDISKIQVNKFDWAATAVGVGVLVGIGYIIYNEVNTMTFSLGE